MLFFFAIMIAALTAGSAAAQTQPTRPSAYPSYPSLRSAYQTPALSPCYSSFDPASPCYSGNSYPSFSAVAPTEIPPETKHEETKHEVGVNNLNEEQVKSRIEAKHYSNVVQLQKDSRGIWRGKATTKEGKSVTVILDLQGNVYSQK